MKAWRHILAAGVAGIVLTGAGLVRAEKITLRNGEVWVGTIRNRNSEGFDLVVGAGGITMIKHINIMDIVDIGPSPAPEPPPAPAAPARVVARAAGGGASATRPAAKEPSHFFAELYATGMGRGPDRLDMLPEDLQAQWQAAVRSEALGNRPETLQLLYKLQDAFAELPHGASRLDAVTQREKHMSFGEWEAHIHWDAIYSRMHGEVVDVGEVRDSEREPLIGLLKEQTDPALKPLKPYFPPIDRKTGRPLAFNRKQLSGITERNALEVKEKATWAAAVLLTQLKVQPDMPGPDRALISQQLQDVNRVLARANALAPLARAAMEKANRERP